MSELCSHLNDRILQNQKSSFIGRKERLRFCTVRDASCVQSWIGDTPLPCCGDSEKCRLVEVSNLVATQHANAHKQRTRSLQSAAMIKFSQTSSHSMKFFTSPFSSYPQKMHWSIPRSQRSGKSFKDKLDFLSILTIASPLRVSSPKKDPSSAY